MPYLAHIIAPQLAQERQKIRAQIGPEPKPLPPQQQVEQWVAQKQAMYARAGATPEQLSAWADYDRKKYTSFLAQQMKAQPGAVTQDEPVDQKPLGSSTPTLRPIGEAAPALPPAYLAQLEQTVGRVPNTEMFHGFRNGLAQLYPVPQVGAEPVAQPPVVVQPKTKGGKVVIELPANGAVATTEGGVALDRRGKKLGYLNQDPNMRTLERRPSDVVLSDNDPFAANVLEQEYGKHLQELKDNGGKKFPAGYFKGMEPQQKLDIQRGVQELMKRNNVVL